MLGGYVDGVSHLHLNSSSVLGAAAQSCAATATFATRGIKRSHACVQPRDTPATATNPP